MVLGQNKSKAIYTAVLRIHDILVWILSADPCLWLLDPDTEPSIFITDLKDANKQLVKKISAYYFLKVLLVFYIIFLRQKVNKKSQNSRNQVFFYYFCLMIEGSGSGSIPLTDGSRRPKNMWTGESGLWSATLLHRMGKDQELPKAHSHQCCDKYAGVDYECTLT
jgi:hypothetical protein